MPIQLPDYQGSVDRVVSGFDNLLQVVRDKKKREERNRAFVRRKMLQEDQQRFRANEAQKGRNFTKGLKKQAAELRKNLQQSDNEFRKGLQDDQNDLRRELQGDQNEVRKELQDDQQEFQMDVLDKKLDAQRNETKASNAGKYSKILQDRITSIRDELDGKYQKVMDDAGIEYSSLATTDTGQIVLKNLRGGGFDGSNVTFEDFRNRMQTPLAEHNKLQEFEKKAGDGYYRRMSSNSVDKSTIYKDSGEPLELYTYEALHDKMMYELQTGGGEDGEYSFYKSIQSGNAKPDTRSNFIADTQIDGESLYEDFKNLEGGKVTLKLPKREDPIVLDFYNDTSSQLDTKLQTVANEVSGDKGNSTNDYFTADNSPASEAYKRGKEWLNKYKNLQSYIKTATPDKYNPDKVSNFKLNIDSDFENQTSWYGYGEKETKIKTKGNNDLPQMTP